jgi:hypothetical protein
MNFEKVIYHHLVEKEINRINKSHNCYIFEIVQIKFEEAYLDTEERLKVRLKSGIVSKTLKKQIACHRIYLGEVFGSKVEFYNASEIIDIIGLVDEGKIKGEPFKRRVLYNYFKIHHGTYSDSGYSLIRNIKEFWFKHGVIRTNRKQEFENILEKNQSYGLAAVIHEMHTHAVYKKELKGEWIIYKECKGIVYFLCLAAHNEGDSNIFETKIKVCIEEFPELENNEN